LPNAVTNQCSPLPLHSPFREYNAIFEDKHGGCIALTILLASSLHRFIVLFHLRQCGVEPKWRQYHHHHHHRCRLTFID